MFNWFNRKKKAENEQTPPPATPPVKAPIEPEPPPESTADLDYLQWAKAAYQTIQQKQETPQPVEEVAASEPEVAAPATPTAVDVAETLTEQVVEVVDSSQRDQPAPPAAVTEPEAAADLAEASPIEPDPTEVSTPEPSQPAWMRKSDGLERLKETALVEEEEDPEPVLAFDEDFLWSARILAEQGRSPDEIDLEEISWLKRLREGLGKTRRSLINQLKAIVGQGPLNEAAVMEIEALLLQADVGVAATDYIIETLQARLREEALPPEEAIAYLKEILCKILDHPLPDPSNAALVPADDRLNIWLMTGVNGAGKTTTIGKLANLAQKSGYPTLIAAADTFRAAAVEQVKVWGERTNTPVIANPGQNTDPAAVVYDAIAAAQARNIQLLLVDTAGRLQNKKNLMEELAKIRRIIDKKAPNAVVESLLVLDSTLGQNGLRQAEVFSTAAQLSGVVLTKLDGTAKGGVALAVAQQLNLPIRFIGAGEGIEDLRPFSSYEFVEALLSD
ncbi:signal recognition particle-docking protein FtsY [Spirulina sp. CCNP1310]|uniref:signal recognition particle-docking protein FtsY n=1 Tax=Spirulina sp. CCNP1310 TaxID=3110249 RepID=UPI002B218F41|nr:signal recognition particle-docking protein FtsY [Spirulina sp. CCNP1310]MEA5418164.1 signal recognition particle-docking protein FtsY [Spirulina sp. CCNP1310]